MGVRVGRGVRGVGPRGVKGAEGVVVCGQSESEPRRIGQDWTARALLFGRVTCNRVYLDKEDADRVELGKGTSC